MYDHILVDGSYVLHRSAYAYSSLYCDGVFTGCLYGFAKTLMDLKRSYPQAQIIVCWDNPANWRKEKYPHYKSDREGVGIPPGVSGPCKTFCTLFGVGQAVSVNNEADDVIAHFVHTLEGRIAIYSSDKDMCQMVSDRVSVINTINGRIQETFTRQDVYNKFSVYPENLLLYRVFDGDASDRLPRPSRFPKQKIASMVSAYSTIADIYSHLSDFGLSKNQMKNILEFKSHAFDNLVLMTLYTDIEVTLDRGEYNKETLTHFLLSYEMYSLKDRWTGEKSIQEELTWQEQPDWD